MEKTMSAPLEVAAKIYKNMKMGSESIHNLLDKVTNKALHTRMTEQMNGYDAYAEKAKVMLIDRGEEAKEESAMTKFWANMGMKMNTLMDSSTSHIAQMMIEGSAMGITDTQKIANEYDGKAGCEEIVKLANEIVKFEEANIRDMKKYL